MLKSYLVTVTQCDEIMESSSASCPKEDIWTWLVGMQSQFEMLLVKAARQPNEALQQEAFEHEVCV